MSRARRWPPWPGWLTRAAARPAGPPPTPPAGVQPTVEWQVCGACNYDCSYCIQSRQRRRGLPDEATVRAIVAALAALPGAWEVKLSGGEPFAYPGLLEPLIGALLAGSPHTLSLLTNLSATPAQLERLTTLAGARLRVVSVSVHLEQVTLPGFVAKAVLLAGLLARHCPQATLVVNSVLVPNRVRQQLAVRDACAAAGLRYFPQWMKIPGGAFPYGPDELPLVEELTGAARTDPWAANRVPSFQGQRCWAGVWYFVVDWRGQAFACRSGRRLDGERATPGAGAWLGDLAAGALVRRVAPLACPYPYCPCTVPAHRGIVEPGPAAAALHAGGGDGLR